MAQAGKQAMRDGASRQAGNAGHAAARASTYPWHFWFLILRHWFALLASLLVLAIPNLAPFAHLEHQHQPPRRSPSTLALLTTLPLPWPPTAQMTPRTLPPVPVPVTRGTTVAPSSRLAACPPACCESRRLGDCDAAHCTAKRDGSMSVGPRLISTGLSYLNDLSHVF